MMTPDEMFIRYEHLKLTGHVPEPGAVWEYVPVPLPDATVKRSQEMVELIYAECQLFPISIYIDSQALKTMYSIGDIWNDARFEIGIHYYPEEDDPSNEDPSFKETYLMIFNFRQKGEYDSNRGDTVGAWAHYFYPDFELDFLIEKIKEHQKIIDKYNKPV